MTGLRYNKKIVKIKVERGALASSSPPQMGFPDQGSADEAEILKRGTFSLIGKHVVFIFLNQNTVIGNSG